MSAATPSGVEPWLRELLRCPECRSELADAPGPQGAPELVCLDQRPEGRTEPCGLAYRVDDGVPVLLVDEARGPDQRGAGAPAGTAGPTGPASGA